MASYVAVRTESDSVVVDGEFTPGEWDSIKGLPLGYGAIPDLPGRIGAWYFMWSKGFKAGPNEFQGIYYHLAHTIEGLVENRSRKYNVFHVTTDTSPPQTLKIWVFENTDTPDQEDWEWLANSEITNIQFYKDRKTFRDVGFLVYNHDTGEHKHFDPEVDKGPHLDPNYNWDSYWGFYACYGFNKSSTDQDIPYQIPGANEVYEVTRRTFRSSDLDTFSNEPVYLGGGEWALWDLRYDSETILTLYNEGKIDMTPDQHEMLMDLINWIFSPYFIGYFM